MGSLSLLLLSPPSTIAMSVKCHVVFKVFKDVEKFKAKALELVKISKKSPGCITSGLFQELGGDTFAIIETWETEAACDEDAAGDHVQGFLKEMGDSVTWDLKKFAAV